MAVGTAAVALTNADWVTLGAAPAILQIQQGSALIAVAASKPAANARGLSLPSGSPPLPVTGAGELWGKSVTSTGTVVVATLA
jgi:hypothetical protein